MVLSILPILTPILIVKDPKTLYKDEGKGKGRVEGVVMIWILRVRATKMRKKEKEK